MTVTELFEKTIERALRGSASFLWSFSPRRATVVIPAFNEEKTIRKVAQTAFKSHLVSEVLVVDDGSADNTVKSLKGLNVRIISHEKNLGKGKAIKTGIENSSNEIIVFIDADIQNIDTLKINKMIMPILENKADFVKSTFARSRGRVTEFAVKPMMRILFPELEFGQPISGQFAGKKEFLSNIKIEDKYGIDIAILLDAVKAGQRVVEVDIGKIIHRGHSNEDVAKMSRQVLETMLKKYGLVAGKYRAFVFSEKSVFDGKKARKNAFEVIQQLKKKKTGAFMIGYSPDAEAKANSLGFDSLIKPKESPQEMLASLKKFLKRQGFKLEETVVIGASKNESLLLKASGIGISFGKKTGLAKFADKTIEELTELLLLE